MLYSVEENAVDYTIYSKGDKMPTDLDLLFDVGGANKIIYVSSISTPDGGGIPVIVKTLKAFVEEFKDVVIVFTIEGDSSDANSVILRYILQQVGFSSLKKFIDEKDATVFMYINNYSMSVYSKIFDEFISFEIEDMLAESVTDPEHSYDRLNLLLKRIGKDTAFKLRDYINTFFSDSTGNNIPEKMNV